MPVESGLTTKSARLTQTKNPTDRADRRSIFFKKILHILNCGAILAGSLFF